jgi:CBS domain containing-hemolysin-like protein
VSWVLEVAGVVMLALAAWLRMAGSAVSELPRADAHHDAAEGVRGARAVADLLDDRQLVAASVAMVGTAFLVLSSVMGVVVVDRRTQGGGGMVVSVLLLAAAIVTVGDVLPRLAGRRRPAIAYRSALLLRAAVAAAGWAAERAPVENGSGTVDTDEENDEEEIALISSVLRFTGTVVREIMVPRQDMVTVAADDPSSRLIASATEHGFSRFPVVEGDDVVGLLLVKDLLPTVGLNGGGVMARDIMRPVVFVPEVKQIADLLAEMRSSRTHMAMVVDEFGDIAGLVTIEDILEELVGEITDETDEEELWIEPRGERTWKVDARLSVEDLSDLLEMELPEGDWDTVGGLVLGLAERVPEESERFDVEGASFTVARMQGRRVAEVIVSDARAVASRETA